MKVEIFKSPRSKYPPALQPWHVRLVGDNGEKLMVSEGYVSKWNAKRAARKLFPDVPVEVVSE